MHGKAREATDGSRRAGAVDTRDIVTGVILAMALPLLCFGLAQVLGPKVGRDPFEYNDPIADLPPDQEEVEAHWQAAAAVYLTNTRQFVKQYTEQSDEKLKESTRTWTHRCFESSRKALDEFEDWFNRNQLAGQFADYPINLAALRKEIDADQQKMKDLDPLKRG